jgi:hypothetical protein
MIAEGLRMGSGELAEFPTNAYKVVTMFVPCCHISASVRLLAGGS